MQAQARRFDFILDTVAVPYPMDPMLSALKRNGTLCAVGIPDRHDFKPLMLAMARRTIAGSGAGGTADTKEMLAFCANTASSPTTRWSRRIRSPPRSSEWNAAMSATVSSSTSARSRAHSQASFVPKSAWL
jgi:D-arabinose 1-dehydrogenase-like Zn-dependent alcohol dehydrogenase